MENKVPTSVNRALGKAFAASPLFRHKILAEPPVAKICILRFCSFSRFGILINLVPRETKTKGIDNVAPAQTQTVGDRRT